MEGVDPFHLWTVLQAGKVAVEDVASVVLETIRVIQPDCGESESKHTYGSIEWDPKPTPAYIIQN